MSQPKFLFPLDGDFVNSRDGLWKDGVLYIDALVESPHGCPMVCDIPALFDEVLGCYKAQIPLYGYRNRVTAKIGSHEQTITVFVTAEEHLKKYRLSSDDNIRFLKELTEGQYTSIFDHPYLSVYKTAHDLYGAKVHLNLFYALDQEASSRFDSKPAYFDLSMMTDRYKEEFRANSHWLKLAFHSRSEFPDFPYSTTGGAVIRKDCTDVCREICRFAGKECISNSATIHWGTANRESVQALRALGFTSLTGYFIKAKDGSPLVSYYIDSETVDHIGSRDFWMDTQEDMIFGRIDCVLNNRTLSDRLSMVEQVTEDPHRGGFVSVMIHEQYFYEDYEGYLADFKDRVLQVCKLLYDKGYTGAHITEVTAPKSLSDYPPFH